MIPGGIRTGKGRRNAREDDLEASVSEDECGIRQSAQFVEQPVRVKGDVGRTVAYMVDTYDLPWLGSSAVFKGWNRLDPPDDGEITRHRRIAEIQGNDNPFVTDPNRMERL